MKPQSAGLKFQIEKGVLLLGMQRVQGIIDKRSTVPILSSVLLEAGSPTPDPQHPTLNIIATDLEIGIKGSYPARVQKDGAVTVSGKKLHDIIRELPEGDIDVSIEEGKFITIRSGKSYFKIAGSDKEDFPSLPGVNEEGMIEIDAPVFVEMIKKTIFAVADADARHVLNGVMLESEGDGNKKVKIRMVGTDGHRLALCEKTIENPALSAQRSALNTQVIIPKKTLHELRRFLDVKEKIKIGIGEKQISFTGEDIFITSRLIDGIYPNYSQVIPMKGERTATINRTDFMTVIRRVSVMSREKTRAILIELLPGKAILRAKDPEIGEATEDIEIKYDGEGLTVGINYQYLLDALESMTEEDVVIEMQSNLTPFVIRQEKDPGHLCIVMPMRVQDME
ncbi:MAG: DNA polymerase III subunit beta [Nitrospirae bacterium]|nr:DNA polymerase III subunit beta [Nitrospirota bacterium]